MNAVAPVSAVIPCYRCAGTIRRALSSVAAQTVRPLEVILVDDGSDDGSGLVLDALAKEYDVNWVRVIRLGGNRGAAAARNAGWDAARAELVAFLDSDDAWHPRKIELQWAFMSANPDVAICGHAHRQVESLGDLPAVQNESPAVQIGLRSLLSSNRFITPSVMLRRGLPLRFRAERRHMEDHLLWLQAVARGHRIVRLDAALAAIFKREFGESGLSAQIFRMTAADVGSYWLLAREREVGLGTAAFYSMWAMLKAVRRWLIVLWRVALGRATVAGVRRSSSPRS